MVEQAAAVGGERQRVGLAAFLERKERLGVGEPGAGVAGFEDAAGQIVGTVLPLGADLARDPPGGGMVEEEDVDAGLEEVHEGVLAADVGQFVDDQRVELVGGKAE